MKGMFKRALAGVAAAALVATGLALGVGSANAVGAVESSPATFTFTAATAEQLTDRTVNVYKIGDYVRYGAEPDAVYGVQAPTGLDGVIRDALRSAVVGETPAVTVPTAGDPMTWAVQEGLLNQSADRPWSAGTTRKFAEALAALAAAGSLTPVAPTPTLSAVTEVPDGSGDGQYQATMTLPAGIYLIVDTTLESESITQAVPMIVYSGVVDGDTLTDITQGQAVNFKNTKNTLPTKQGNKDTVSVGDTITYTLSQTLPNPAPEAFQFNDVPSIGLTVCEESGFTVEANDVPLEEDAYTVDLAALTDRKGDGQSIFIVKFNDPSAYAGQTITVTYTATVNDQAYGADGAGSTVSNKLVNNDGTVEYVYDESKLYGFGFTKVDSNGDPLSGATFTLTAVSPTVLPAGYTHTTSTSADETGRVSFSGLAAGTYQVEETGTPNGYMDMNLTFTVTIEDADGDGVATVTFGEDTWGLVDGTDPDNVTVTNVENVTQLPLTGAAGTALFTVLGLLIAGIGVLAYVKSRSVRSALRRG